MTTTFTVPLLGEADGPHHPNPDHGKTMFVYSVLRGAHGPSAEMYQVEDFVYALRAYYVYIGSPDHRDNELAAEATWWHQVRPGVLYAAPAWYPMGVQRAMNDLRSDLASFAWLSTTAANAEENLASTHRSTGQCAVTALVVQERLGGQLARVEYRAGGPLDPTTSAVRSSHYFNVLDGGFVVDLTRDQFDGQYAPIGDPQVRTREYLLSNPDTAARYALLRDRL